MLTSGLLALCWQSRPSTRLVCLGVAAAARRCVLRVVAGRARARRRCRARGSHVMDPGRGCCRRAGRGRRSRSFTAAPAALDLPAHRLPAGRPLARHPQHRDDGGVVATVRRPGRHRPPARRPRPGSGTSAGGHRGRGGDRGLRRALRARRCWTRSSWSSRRTTRSTACPRSSRPSRHGVRPAHRRARGRRRQPRRDRRRGRAAAAAPRVVRCDRNRGQGAALRLGYRIAREHGASYIITTDADGQYDVADLPVVLAPVLEGRADFVTGSRRLGHQPVQDPCAGSAFTSSPGCWAAAGRPSRDRHLVRTAGHARRGRPQS